MTENFKLAKTKFDDWLMEHGQKISVIVSSVAGSVMSMTISASAEGETTDVSATVGTIISCMEKGYTFIMGQPVLATCFVGGIVGTLVFGNIKKAKRAVK